MTTRSKVTMEQTLHPIHRDCLDCGRQYTITPGEQEFYARMSGTHGRAWKLPFRCEPCRRARRRGANTVRNTTNEDIALHCVRCGSPFIFSVSDQSYYLSMGFQQPRRCASCRRTPDADPSGRVREDRSGSYE